MINGENNMIIKVDTQLVSETKDMILNSEFRGIPTGFKGLDSYTGGFGNGELIIMGARPGMGKTTFACSLINNVCINKGLNCILISLEMYAKHIIERLINIHGDVSKNDKIENGYTDRIIAAANDVEKANLWINDSCTCTIDKYIEKCMSIGRKEKINLIIIDYLQLIEHRNIDLKKLLMKLKQLAIDLDCPIFVLSQLNRTADARKGMPQLVDFPYFKIIEECSDEILLLYRDSYYNTCKDENDNAASISIVKHSRCNNTNVFVFYDPMIPKFCGDK